MAGALASLDMSRLASPREMSAIAGMITWNDLLSRPLLSALHRTYGFCRDRPLSSARAVSSDVIGELFLNPTLAPFWIVDLTREWLPFITCSDAAPSFGYGMATCSLGCCARRSNKGDCPS